MNIWKYTGVTIITLLLAPVCFAHGEDKPGPHNGVIRMPGDYHVEVMAGKETLDIMLLDANFKNPTVLNSHIKVKIRHGDNAYVLRCESKDNYYSCPVSNKMLTSKGTLHIESERQLSAGMPVEYPLPLTQPDEVQTA